MRDMQYCEHDSEEAVSLCFQYLKLLLESSQFFSYDMARTS